MLALRGSGRILHPARAVPSPLRPAATPKPAPGASQAPAAAGSGGRQWELRLSEGQEVKQGLEGEGPRDTWGCSSRPPAARHGGRRADLPPARSTGSRTWCSGGGELQLQPYGG